MRSNTAHSYLRHRYFVALTLFVSCLGAVWVSARVAADESAVATSDLESQFAEQLTGATLVGHFTDMSFAPNGSNNPTGEPAELNPEKYVLGEVRKLDNNRWLFQARIQYGEHDVTVPLALPVEWAGDTAVIAVDKLGVPGLGTYTARVMVHGNNYAGYWQGATHGGHLFGHIERPSKD